VNESANFTSKAMGILFSVYKFSPYSFHGMDYLCKQQNTCICKLMSGDINTVVTLSGTFLLEYALPNALQTAGFKSFISMMDAQFRCSFINIDFSVTLDILTGLSLNLSTYYSMVR
jgi:hypothetical protein